MWTGRSTRARASRARAGHALLIIMLVALCLVAAYVGTRPMATSGPVVVTTYDPENMP